MGFLICLWTLFFSGQVTRGTSAISYPPRGQGSHRRRRHGTPKPSRGSVTQRHEPGSAHPAPPNPWDRWGHCAGLQTHQPSFQRCLPASICWVEAINTFIWIFFLYCICFLIEHSFSFFFFFFFPEGSLCCIACLRKTDGVTWHQLYNIPLLHAQNLLGNSVLKQNCIALKNVIEVNQYLFLENCSFIQKPPHFFKKLFFFREASRKPLISVIKIFLVIVPMNCDFSH